MNSNILFSLRNKQSRLFLNKESALKPDSERALFLFRVSGISFLVSEKGDIIFARPYGGIQGVRWAAGHMGPALHGIFVGQGTRALPWVRYGIGGRTGASAPTDDKEICASMVWADVGIGPYESVTRSAFGIGRAG